MACLGGALALWRSQIANKDVGISARGLRDKRYQKAVEMLADNTRAIRLGGIYALKNLGQEAPEHFHVQVMEVLTAFVRYGDAESTTQKEGMERVGVEDAIKIIKARTEDLLNVEKKQNYTIDLAGSLLEGMDFSDATMSCACLKQSKLSQASFGQAKLDGADFTDALISKTDFMSSELDSADFTGADLTASILYGSSVTHACFRNTKIAGVNFDQVRGLTQDQLNEACQPQGGDPPYNLPAGLHWDG